MTNPQTPNNPGSSPSLASRVQSWWLMPLIYLGLGVVILIAQAIDGNTRSGVGWFLVMAAVAALYAFGGRFSFIRQARGDFDDERDASIQQRAMAMTGLVFVLVLTGCIVFELARGHNPSPYSMLMAVGGATYAISLLILRNRS